MTWAACCITFLGFLWCSEFTVPSSNGFEPVTNLSLKDTALDNKTSPSLVRINIKQSKTDPFRKGFHLFLRCTDHHICPVKALLPYLAVCGSREGPLFITEEGSPLARHCFSTELSSILHAAELETTHYNTHSFHIGAATLAKQAGISDLHIKMLGKWQSNAYETYITMPRQQLAALSKQLVTSHCNLLLITTSHCCNTTFVCILSLVMYFRYKQRFFDWVAIW